MVCLAVKADVDVIVGDFHVGWHLYDVAKDLSALSIGAAPNSLSQEPIHTAGNHYQCHIKVDLENRRGGCVHMQKAHRIEEHIFNEHAPGAASDEPFRGDARLIIDSPPVLAVTDEVDLARAADAVSSLAQQARPTMLHSKQKLTLATAGYLALCSMQSKIHRGADHMTTTTQRADSNEHKRRKDKRSQK